MLFIIIYEVTVKKILSVEKSQNYSVTYNYFFNTNYTTLIFYYKYFKWAVVILICQNNPLL